MMTGSVGGSGWTPEGEMVSIQIDGRPAYRLLVQNPLSNGCGYVAESNGRTGKNEAGKLSLFARNVSCCVHLSNHTIPWSRTGVVSFADTCNQARR
jgi:hypothetical protein